MFSSGSHHPYVNESSNISGAVTSAHPALATPSLVPSCIGDGNQSEGVGSTSEQGMEFSAQVEPLQAPAPSGDQSLESVPSRAMVRSQKLLHDHEWSSRTKRTRDTQWRTSIDFCTTDNRDPLPATEAHFVAFIGWLFEERQAGRRRIGSSSIPLYFSAVRQLQLLTNGVSVTELPFFPHVLRAFQRWEEKEIPQSKFRL